MSAVPDIAPRAMAEAAEARAAGSAAKAIQPTQPSRYHNMSDGDLADAHRGQSFALERAKGDLKAIEAELERRGVTKATGKLGEIVRRTNHRLFDIRRLRAEMGEDFFRRFALAGSETFWRSRTLTADERAPRR